MNLKQQIDKWITQTPEEYFNINEDDEEEFEEDSVPSKTDQEPVKKITGGKVPSKKEKIIYDFEYYAGKDPKKHKDYKFLKEDK